jgi:hypothetical protein
MKTATARPSRNGTHFASARDAAERYLREGLSTIPNHPRTKRPNRDAWENIRVNADNFDLYFPPGEELNIGVLNGAASGNLADTDLDCRQAVIAGSFLLPPTGWQFGRASAPGSHRVYRTDAPFPSAQEKFKDLDGAVLVELRGGVEGSQGQTIFPGSVHESGEPVEWEEFTTPAEVKLDDLRRSVCETAAATLLARHWPSEGSRHDAALALAGGLLRAGWDQERVELFVRATATAAGDPEVEDRVRAVGSTVERIADGGKATGWPSLVKAMRDGKTIVDVLHDWLKLKSTAASLEPVTPEPPRWPYPPAPEAFHGLPGKIVRAIEPASEADPAALLVQTLVAFGNTIGRGAGFHVEESRHHCNEFVVVVGRTSKARKGTSWDRVEALYRGAEELWAGERVQSGLSSGEGLIWAVRDPITKREKINQGRGQAPTYEEVEADPGVSDKRLMVVEQEYANVLKQTERQVNTLSVILRQAWDGKNLRAMTKNSPARSSNPHVSLVGHITVEELRRYLTQTESANGFGNRHLWVCAARSKQLPEGGRMDASIREGLIAELADAIAFGRAAGDIVRDDESRSLWHDVYGELSDGKPGLAGALLGRAEAHVMRLAILYALMDRSVSIGIDHLQAALCLWEFVERSVLYVFGDCLGDPVADDLLRLLRGSADGLTRTHIRDYFQRNTSAERIGQALGLLLQHKLARQEKVETGGRPSERWFATARKG